MSWFGFGSKTTVVADSEAEKKEVKFEPFTDEVFDKFIAVCTDMSNEWSVIFEDKKKEMTVWSKKSSESAINTVRARVYFRDLDPELVYDVIHDHKYRTSWDENMIEGYMLKEIDHHNAIGYYALKLPSPISSRDFVNHRGWTARRNANPPTYVICNNSVIYPDCPEKPGFVRGWSHRTGYIMRKLPEGGTEFYYYTLSDPKGWIPAWVLNAGVSVTGPKVVQKLAEVIPKYPEWAKVNRPEGTKPWQTPPSSPRREEKEESEATEKKKEGKEGQKKESSNGEKEKKKK